jgi:hypothetical protein
MLFYTILMTLITFIAFLCSIGVFINKFGSGNFGIIVTLLVILAAVILDMVIFVTIFLFLKFHLELVFSNQTTLETLELKRAGKDPESEVSEYNIGTSFLISGKYYNWVQVFGRSSFTWWLPIFFSN